MKPKFSLIGISIILLLFVSASPARSAVKTSASFDANYSFTGLGIKVKDLTTGAIGYDRTLNSYTGFELDYNVALFDYSAIAFISFLQYGTSNLGKVPLSRFAIGAAYHFIRMNGQRVILDNQVEAKSWGISPALEISIGMSRLSVEDPDPSITAQFTASMLDIFPRLLFEIPVSPSLLMMVRGGYLFSISTFTGQSNYTVTYGGYSFLLGIKLSTI